MKKIMKGLCILLILQFMSVPGWSQNTRNIEVCFTPGENCTQKIINEIAAARHSILVQAYSFTSAPIAKALVDANKRGVKVNVILDKSQKSAHYSSTRFLTNQHIPTWIDDKVAIAHNKVIIIDEAKIITGSFNFTKAAQYKNAENLLIIKDPDIAKEYMRNWWSRRQVSKVINE